MSLSVRPREPVLRHTTAEEGHDYETLNQFGNLVFSNALVLFTLQAEQKLFSLELLVSRPASSILYVVFCSVAQLNLHLQKISIKDCHRCSAPSVFRQPVDARCAKQSRMVPTQRKGSRHCLQWKKGLPLTTVMGRF